MGLRLAYPQNDKAQIAQCHKCIISVILGVMFRRRSMFRVCRQAAICRKQFRVVTDKS